MKYSIEDTTLTALGEATRRFTDAFRIVEWDELDFEWELSHEGGMTNNGVSGWYAVKKHFQYTSGANKIYMRVKYPEKGYTFEVMGDKGGAWDPAVTPEYELRFNADNYIRRTDNIPEPCILINRYEDMNGNPVGNHYEEEVVNTLTPGQMIEVLETFDLGAIIPESALTITGSCSYKFAYGGWDWFINQLGPAIMVNDVTLANYMFTYSTLTRIPFVINMKDYSSQSYAQHDLSYMFYYATKLRTVPMVYGAKPKNINYLFSHCEALTSIPSNFAADWDWSYLENLTSGYTGTASYMFDSCYKLKAVPQALISHGNPYWSNGYTTTATGFRDCYCLQELVDVFIPHLASYSGSYSNAFTNAFDNCSRLKRLTFKTVDGDPLTAKSWNNQTINLTTVGYFQTPSYATSRAGLPADAVIDTEDKWYSYRESGGYSNWYATDVAYSTFGASAAREFFASLPQVGGTGNMVYLNPNAASAIPGEAMSSLTEEDIAIAAARGWTISLK